MKQQNHIKKRDRFFSDSTIVKRWQEHIQFKYEIKKPVASRNKEKISVWIVYWPFSLFWSLIHDFVRRVVERLVIRIQKIYQLISDRAYKNIEP